MSKTKTRRSFPEDDRPQRPSVKKSFSADESIGGVYGFFRDFGTRETIESIIVAVVLALMFRAFEAEAFIIPTGSMAPSLQGEHKELECENCGFRHRAGASQESSTNGNRVQIKVKSTFCPICQYENEIPLNPVGDYVTNSGDRLLVNKFVYDFCEPRRYDVIVFKYPNNSKQNYIKRLIGLPGDNILIENGDIYLMTRDADGQWSREISRKPPQKLRNVLQEVDDTDFIGTKLKKVGWPSRWQEFSGGDKWEQIEIDGKPGFVSQKTDQPSWLRYRHFRPFKNEWPTIKVGDLPARFRQPELPAGRLIGDQYSYNDAIDSGVANTGNKDLGLHWVGDIGLECWAEIDSASGNLLLDVVEGGAHFVCKIDVATGIATLTCSDPTVRFQSEKGQVVAAPTAVSNLKGTGKYHVEFVNADDRIHLWINNRLVKFDAAEYQRDGIVIPKYTPLDPGDAEPVGVSAENLDVRFTRLKVVRDIYYTSVRGEQNSDYLPNESGYPVDYVLDLQQQPAEWGSSSAVKFFETKKGQTSPMFQLQAGATRDKDQFLPMGDNSPQSADGRIWEGPKYLERDLLIGRALVVYWPHTLNKPIKYFPNFGRMDFIR